MTLDEVFKELSVFDECRIIEESEGSFSLESRVTERNINPYGTAHGGYLYTLCDTVAGVTAATMGDYCVTLQGNINYIKPAEKDDVLLVTGKICHNGRKTKVIEVNIIDQNGSLICKSTFTMYSVGKISE